jgi:hypothetical protein
MDGKPTQIMEAWSERRRTKDDIEEMTKINGLGVTELR